MWSRWHITLSQYGGISSSPLSKFLTQLLGPQNVNHAVAMAIVVVFLFDRHLIWRRLELRRFGLLQALGVVSTHYHIVGLKKWLGREGFRAYNSNPLIHAAAVVITFLLSCLHLVFLRQLAPADEGDIPYSSIGTP